MTLRLALLKPLVSLSEPRTLSEQLELLLKNCLSPTIPGILLASLLAWTLSNAGNARTIFVWWLCTVSWRVCLTGLIWRTLRSPQTQTHPRRAVGWSMLLNGVDMVCWGGLAWIGMDPSSLANSVLVVAVLAGVAGNTMSTMSPVLPVFLFAFSVEVIVVCAKFWGMGDPAYNALGWAVVLYMLTMIWHALNNHAAVCSAISLRFENERLIGELKTESDNARIAQSKAEQANIDKSKFLAAASHDLRQPIHAQGLFLNVLADDTLNSATRVQVLANAQMAWRASADMLNTLLDFSRIEAGVLEPQVRSFHLQPLLHRIEAEIAPQADGKQLIYRTRETPAVVSSDPALVELVLRNLVTNAVRYTDHGGVLVCARQRRGQVVLEVWDTGVGIAPEHHQDIFKEFHQLGNAERDRRKGLGLGLAIARKLADQLGHTLSVRSRPGRGSCFCLSMPLAQGAVATDPHEHLAPMQPLHLSVLVIDDDTLVQEGMRTLLQRWRCECSTAESVEQALSQDWLRAPQLIVSDYRLRHQATGARAIDQLRAHWGEPIPAILLTGDTARERLREAKSTGIPLLHKPVSPLQLYHMIRATCSIS
jgi:signal transduction histidine kinase